jgi:hypothetical protein
MRNAGGNLILGKSLDFQNFSITAEPFSRHSDDADLPVFTRIPTFAKSRTHLWGQFREATLAKVGGHFIASGAADPAQGVPIKKGPEKSDPTQLSYHSALYKSTAKWPGRAKICALHKNECLHLGNIPS